MVIWTHSTQFRKDDPRSRLGQANYTVRQLTNPVVFTGRQQA